MDPCLYQFRDWKRRHLGQVALYMSLINILLVLSRARTSTMIVSDGLSVYSDFVSRLNSTLNSLPPSSGATHHRLEIVQRTKAAFFVVCSRSPRFIWSRSLTQQDVGRNLDFCGPGHFTHRKLGPSS